MNTLGEYIVAFGMGLIGCLIFAAGMTWLTQWYDSNQCETYSQVTGRETKYRTGMCYVKEDNKWYSWSEYKLRNAGVGR